MEALNKIADFIDQHIRIVRYGAPVLGAIGIAFVLRHTHAFTLFKGTNTIPGHIIKSNSTIRGVTKDIVTDRLIKVQHLPIFFRNLEKRKKYFGEEAVAMDVAIAGISPKQGCLNYLKICLLHENLKIIPLHINDENSLEAIIYLKKQGVLSRSICINKELVANGLAIADYDKKMTSVKLYNKLSNEILAAEVKADKKGLGVWKRPSIKERLRNWWKKIAGGGTS